jgi:hypothetical protein
MAKMRLKLGAVLAAVLAVIAIAAASASADVTIGQVILGFSAPPICPFAGDGFVVASAVNGNPYVVPSGGGEITQWSTTWGASGTNVALVVLQPISFALQVVGWDSESFPTSAPGHVATFTLSTPIAVAAGDSIGLYAVQSSSAVCEFAAGPGNSLEFIEPVLGQQTIFTDGGTIVPEISELPNVEAVVTQSADLALSAPASLASVASGGVVAFSVSASTAGASEAATVTDTLSSRLTPVAATVGSVACSVSGQTFSCPLAGEPATISVLAQAASTGAATNTATITGSLTDPVAANNSATTSLTIAAGATPSTGPSTPASCALAPLQGVRLALAQTIVTDLGCKDGAVKKHSSKSVPKGELISTSPAGPASVTAGTAVSFTVSSGKPVKHKRGAKPKPKH